MFENLALNELLYRHGIDFIEIILCALRLCIQFMANNSLKKNGLAQWPAPANYFIAKSLFVTATFKSRLVIYNVEGHFH